MTIYRSGLVKPTITFTSDTDDIQVPAGEDLTIKMGDTVGGTKVSFVDYAEVEVAYIDSDGNISGVLTPTLPLTLDSTVTTYTDKVGITTAFSHSGAITGIADEVAVVSMIAPTATVTDPTTADGFNYVGLAVDMSGVGITAGTGTTNVTAIGIVTNSDADVEGAYALAFADNYVEVASSYLMKMGNLGIDMVNAATGDTGFGISIDYATTDYKDGSGIIKLERSGDFTGTDAESSIDLLIAPTNEVTAPGIGEEFVSAGLVIDQSGQTTAAGTGGDVVQRALYLNAASKGEAIYSASGYVTHNSTFESLDNLFQVEGVPSEDITGYGGVGVFAVENSAGTAQTNGAFIWGVSASLSGNASDTSAIYVGFVSPTVNKNGGTSTAVAHGILPGYDYALYADAASTDMDGDDLVIKAMDGYDSGATDRDGGDIVLTPGSAANAGSDGVVVIDGDMTLGGTSLILSRSPTSGLLIQDAPITSGGETDVGVYALATLNDSGAAGGSDEFVLFGGQLVDTDTTGWDDVYLMYVGTDSGSSHLAIDASAPEMDFVGSGGDVVVRYGNENPSNDDLSRKTQIFFNGQKADTTDHSIAYIQASHDGAGDDQKGQIDFYVNDGDDNYAPSINVLNLSSGGLISIKSFAVKTDAVTASGNSGRDSYYFGCDTLGADTITLQTADCVDGRIIVIKDEGGNASVQNITVATEGAETIDGAATLTISGDYDSVTLIARNSNWWII